jgi:hypothetical protein
MIIMSLIESLENKINYLKDPNTKIIFIENGLSVADFRKLMLNSIPKSKPYQTYDRVNVFFETGIMQVDIVFIDIVFIEDLKKINIQLGDIARHQMRLISEYSIFPDIITTYDFTENPSKDNEINLKGIGFIQLFSKKDKKMFNHCKVRQKIDRKKVGDEWHEKKFLDVSITQETL